VKIMMLRVNGIIGPVSAAAYVVLSPSLTAGDIHGTQRGRRLSPRSVTAGHAKTNLNHCGL
jgi:hypothetical protein